MCIHVYIHIIYIYIECTRKCRHTTTGIKLPTTGALVSALPRSLPPIHEDAITAPNAVRFYTLGLFIVAILNKLREYHFFNNSVHSTSINLHSFRIIKNV